MSIDYDGDSMSEAEWDEAERQHIDDNRFADSEPDLNDDIHENPELLR